MYKYGPNRDLIIQTGIGTNQMLCGRKVKLDVVR